MAKALSKSQVAAAVAEKNCLSKKQAAEILDSIADLAYKNAKNTFTLPGLGKLVLVNRKARIGRNPATGEADQHSRQARGEVPRGEGREGRHPGREVSRQFFNEGTLSSQSAFFIHGAAGCPRRENAHENRGGRLRRGGKLLRGQAGPVRAGDAFSAAVGLRGGAAQGGVRSAARRGIFVISPVRADAGRNRGVRAGADWAEDDGQ